MEMSLNSWLLTVRFFELLSDFFNVLWITGRIFGESLPQNHSDPTHQHVAAAAVITVSTALPRY